jgi:hypothetical protein
MHFHVIIAIVVFGALDVSAVLNTPARRPIIVVGVDGLSARSVEASAGFAPILANSSYTLRARATEHTRSYEGWQSVFMGGYVADALTYETGPNHPRLFDYVRSQMPDAVLWYIGRYYYPAYAVNNTAADLSVKARTASAVADAFVGNVNSNNPPDLAVLYIVDIDDIGHGIGWDSPEYKHAVEDVAYQIKRIHFAVPNALIYIVSDHGGRGGGHTYWGRNMADEETDIDTPWHRDVPWIRYGDRNPRPLCDTILTGETAADIAHALDIKPHFSWQMRAGWMPQDAPCTAQDVASRVLISAATRSLTAPIVAVLCSLPFIVV